MPRQIRLIRSAIPPGRLLWVAVCVCLVLAARAGAEPWDPPATPSALPLPRSATLPVPPGFADSLAVGGAMAPLAAFFRGLSLLDSGAFAQAAQEFSGVAAHPLAGFLARDALLLAGYAREAAGDPAGALAAYEGWLAAGPEMLLSQTVWLRAGAVAARVGETRKAGDFLRKLCLTRPWTDEAGHAAALARVLFASGRIDWNPDAPQVLLAQAERAIDARRTEAATRILDRLAAAPGDNDPARLDYLRGKIDFAKRRTDEALARFRGVRERFPASTIAPWAAYHEARCLWRRTDPESAVAMERVLRRVVEDVSVEVRAREVSARHLMLLLAEQGRLAEALEAAGILADLGRGGELAEQARALSGVLCFALGRFPEAEAHLAGFVKDFPESDWLPGARHWLGRTLAARGDARGAMGWYRANMAWNTNSYYGLRSAAEARVLAASTGLDPAAAPPARVASERARTPGAAVVVAATNAAGESAGPGNAPSAGVAPVGTPGAEPPPAMCPGQAAPAARSPEVRAMFERAEFLDRSGLSELAELDLAWLAAAHPDDAELALSHIRLATRLFRLGPATATARRSFGDCLSRGDPARFGPLAEALYPRRHVGAIRAALSGSDVSENLILGLIRQESFFNEKARSSAGAVGLMQLLPQTAANMAARIGLKPFAATMLTDPAVNIRLGVEYYKTRHAQYGDAAHTLCSYNAGAGKLAVWLRGIGGLEQDLFVELIPYEETRDYVRKVLTNAMFYEALAAGR
ncbi:transglycosylase SLT domain-containing protein [Desulfolutivibrio sulfoxidireducens]|uniref:lytic transglycosylase domain-containing protein n=1 Tax=Desulfolutivibrio sulfoxidireducens TaxID=2773299 RepID=UPI00159E2AC8|nr:transglycosylase SLT domain-containing protein [Desulfolutivibrio sulfoxidireducens]QLA14981.1 transglycosylase SLT domain-containing protein [Desulfolutivibrio sulfoxidireducens]